MTDVWQWSLVAFAMVFGLLGVIVRLGTKRRLRRVVVARKHTVTWDELFEWTSRSLHEVVNGDLRSFGVSDEQFARMRQRRLALKHALRTCTSGNENDKRYVRRFIYDSLATRLDWDDALFDLLIPFREPEQLTAIDRFDILLYVFRQRFGHDGLAQMLKQMEQIHREIEPLPMITPDHIRQLYQIEQPLLQKEDKLELIAQRVYQQMKGFGVIDELREMNIDGVSGGVSGLPSSLTMSDMNEASYDFDSIWIFYRGVSIHLQCLSFGSHEELKRVCQNIYKHNFPGQLSERTGYKVNQLADGSRVVVVRPPFAESWAFFIRKFDVPKASLEQLVRGEGELFLRQLLIFLIKGARVTAVTGAQGTGKTTLLMALVRHIDRAYNIRVQEMAFELRLRSIYPERNILTFCETVHISGQEGLDVQKKTDGSVNIIGEVASDAVAAWMIQAAQVASLFTLFTHHAKTFADLVYSLRNSLLKIGVFSSEAHAEQEVVRVLHFNVHLRRETNGARYVERVTECIPQQPKNEHAFLSQDVARYENGRWLPGVRISASQIEQMLTAMSPADQTSFATFLAHYWPDGERLCV